MEGRGVSISATESTAATMAGRSQQRFSYGSGRPIRRRGQVKVAIVVGLAHSLASFLSHSRRPSSSSFYQHHRRPSPAAALIGHHLRSSSGRSAILLEWEGPDGGILSGEFFRQLASGLRVFQFGSES